jgi:hypothetical protein
LDAPNVGAQFSKRFPPRQRSVSKHDTETKEFQRNFKSASAGLHDNHTDKWEALPIQLQLGGATMTFLHLHGVRAFSPTAAFSGTWHALAHLVPHGHAAPADHVACRSLDKLDDEQLADIGIVRHEEFAGWHESARGSHPDPIMSKSYSWR